MPLYAGKRDISLFNTVNKELIIQLMDTPVLYFKVSLNNSVTNIYGEGLKKVFNDPVQLHCVITHEDQATAQDQFGTDVGQPAIFSFLKVLLVEADIFPEPGDIVQWNNGYYEIDNTNENRLVGGKNPDALFPDPAHPEDFGSSHSIICSAHLTRLSNIDMNPHRFGNGGNYLEGNGR